MITRRVAMAGLALATAFSGQAKADAMQSVTEFQWRYAADTVMGGISQGQGGLDGDILRLSGTVSTANNGGFIQVRANLPDGLPSNAIRLRVRGNGEQYFVHLRSIHSVRPWLSYRAGFETSQDWTEVTLPITAFAPSRGTLPPELRPEDVRSVGLVAFGRDHEADLSVSSIGFC